MPLMLTTGGSTVAKFLYLKTSFTDFFQFINSITPAGMGVEWIGGVETWVIEDMGYFLNNSLTPILLENVSDVKIRTASDLIPNIIKVGFPNQSYGEEYGGQEFMQTFELKAPQEFLTNELNWVSPYRMDNAGLDYIYFQALKNGFGTPAYKIDDWADDNIFALHCKFHSTVGNTTYYELDRDNIIITDTTFDNPAQAFNLFYTPKRNLLNHGKYLSGALKFFETKNITVSSVGKYPYLRTQETAQAEIAEVTSILISSLASPYFFPLYVTLIAPVTDAFEAAYIANYGAPIKFEIENEYYYGFVMSVSKRFAGTKESEFLFLMTPSNNLKNLI